MKPNLGLAARTLALDLATGEVVRGMDAAGIGCMVLKGPAMAHRLYGDTPGGRNYGDIDLLVAPRHFGDAGRVLASLGFKDQLPGIRASEAARMQGHPWHRDSAAHIVVDLHRGFHHVADRPTWWDLLNARRVAWFRATSFKRGAGSLSPCEPGTPLGGPCGRGGRSTSGWPPAGGESACSRSSLGRRHLRGHIRGGRLALCSPVAGRPVWRPHSSAKPAPPVRAPRSTSSSG